jgi:hypothetical protein
MPGRFDLAKNAFGDYYGQHVAIVKSRERGFWQSISKDPVKSALSKAKGVKLRILL